MGQHNNSIKYVPRNFAKSGYETFLEPRIPIGVQVASNSKVLDTAHDEVSKYSVQEFIRTIKDIYNALAALTTSWRGIWSESSVKYLLPLDIFRKSELALLSVRAIFGTEMYFAQFT